MKNKLKRITASVMAITTLAVGANGVNVTATDTNVLVNTKSAISDIPSRTGYYFYLNSQNESYLTYRNGSATVHYAASVNQGGVNIIIRDSIGNPVGGNYISAGSSMSFSINIPSGETYYFYAQSSTAKPSYIISGTAYIY